MKPGDDPIPEALIEEAAASSDLCTNKIDPFKAEGQDSSATTKEDKETSSINNAAQASVPKVEDREGHNSILPTHPDGWPTNPSQWTWTVLALLTKTGTDKAKDADNSDLTRLPPDLLEERPTMPVSNVGRQGILPEIVHVAEDVLGQTLSTSTTKSIPMRNWNLLTRLPKSATSSTQ